MDKGLKLYRIKVRSGLKWKMGLNDYTLTEAANRVNQLKAVGIKCKVVLKAELFE
jgi:hypothetical protein